MDSHPSSSALFPWVWSNQELTLFQLIGSLQAPVIFLSPSLNSIVVTGCCKPAPSILHGCWDPYFPCTMLTLDAVALSYPLPFHTHSLSPVPPESKLLTGCSWLLPIFQHVFSKNKAMLFCNRRACSPEVRTLPLMQHCTVFRQFWGFPNGPAVLIVTIEVLTASPEPGYHIYLSYFDWNSSLVCLSGYWSPMVL